jgi:hypothetical protein
MMTPGTSSIGRCPCGGTFRILPGVYESLDNALHVLSGPEHTFEQFRRLKEILERAKAKQDAPEVTVERIRSQLSPRRGGWIRRSARFVAAAHREK